MTGTTFDMRYHPLLRPLLAVFGMRAGRSGVTVTADAVEVRMGWAFRARVPRTALRGVRREPPPLLFGAGVHGWGGRWAVNGGRAGGVRVDLDPPGRARVCGIPVRLATLWVTLADPDAFVASVGSSATRT